MTITYEYSGQINPNALKEADLISEIAINVEDAESHLVGNVYENEINEFGNFIEEK